MTAHQALVLNADFRPLSYFPLSLLGWQDAVRLIFQDKLIIVAEYDRVIRSPSREMRLLRWSRFVRSSRCRAA